MIMENPFAPLILFIIAFLLTYTFMSAIRQQEEARHPKPTVTVTRTQSVIP